MLQMTHMAKEEEWRAALYVWICVLIFVWGMWLYGEDPWTWGQLSTLASHEFDSETGDLLLLLVKKNINKWQTTPQLDQQMQINIAH